MEEILTYIKETKNTVVYGNENIQAIYLPKSKFDVKDDIYPTEIKMNITW